MLDFLMVSTRPSKRGPIEIYPKFVMNNKSSDLMIRGSDFYAIWVEERGLWSTDEQDAIQLIDEELDRYAEKNKDLFDGKIKILHMWDAETGMIDKFHHYCQKQTRDNFHMLDEKLVFSNSPTKKKDYASKRLNYPLQKGETPAYDELMSTLYSDDERHKIEWCIGSIVCGDSKKIQKFMVLYGSGGTGKSTVLNIIQDLFNGYYSVFDAKALGSASNSFALESFKTNPLVAIQHDGDLSKIEDNTRLNSLVSHEMMTVNEKFKTAYSNQFKSFLFMGTNKPVKITDGKSGIIRRLIDVTPTGKKLSGSDYFRVTSQIKFELGAIAYHCEEVYLSDPRYYDEYVPTSMLGASNDFYNFVLESYPIFKSEDAVSLKVAWEMYKEYCDEAKVSFPFSKRIFKEELKNYFWEYSDRIGTGDGSRTRSYYSKFRTDKFEDLIDLAPKKEQKIIPKSWLDFQVQPSIFDDVCKDCYAQYSSDSGTPQKKWENVKTTLSDLDTTKLHYVRVPKNHIVIDFDITGDDGKKSFEKNLEEASKWPPTYAELSKSGAGIHLHYIYDGDPSKLSAIYDEHVEVKVFSGNSSLRRKLSKCVSLAIATICSGLPLKGEKMVNFTAIKSEKGIRTLIKKNLNKEIHNATKPSIDFINQILDDAQKNGLKYDVTDMRNAILAFAASSTNNAEYCIKLVNKMAFKSEDPSESEKNDDAPLVFYDVEVFPNLFIVNWKMQGSDNKVVRMINPAGKEIEDLVRFRLVGFNCRRYDNHILYARMIGYSNEELYKLSQKIISGSSNCFFGEAYNISYTDIYDFSSIKQSLKKFEIKLGIHHHELGLPWDQPVPEELWTKVAEYCDDDVLATEATFEDRKADFTARKILADVAGMTVNDTTNSLTTRIIFGGNKKPQGIFNYRNLALPVSPDRYEEYRELFGPEYKFRMFSDTGLPLYEDFDPKMKYPNGYSILPFFPGYKYEFGKSTYMGSTIGEGGRVYSEPGMYGNLWDGDIASQHPHSAIMEVVFGPEYTKRFEELVEARVAIKHKDFSKAKKMLGGALAKYLLDEAVASDLAQALKIAINSVYGLTSASFENPFRDKRNVDNIVAKRGALFMELLRHEVNKRHYKVAHIKTDSIKIPDADQEVIDFVTKFGREYGYNFETEADFEKFCIVNDAVYVAKYKEAQKDKKTGEDIWWTATGTQFQVPYVFKKLFSKKDIVFEDLCETKSVKNALYLDMNETLPDVSTLEKQLEKDHKNGAQWSSEQLAQIDAGHNYIFVGKVGLFCPIKPGCGGGLLVSEREGKYNSATGSKGYRWLESEMVKELKKEDSIDRSYYDKLVDGAISTISEFGDFEWFVSNDPYIAPEEAPWFKNDENSDLPWHDDEPFPWEEDKSHFDVR